MYSKEPALAVVAPWEIEQLKANTPENNLKLKGKIGQGFAPIRDSISKLEKTIQSDKDGSTTMQFDTVVNETLAGIKDPKERQTVSDWVSQKRQSEQRHQLINALGPAAVSILSAFAGEFWVPVLIAGMG